MAELRPCSKQPLEAAGALLPSLGATQAIGHTTRVRASLRTMRHLDTQANYLWA